MRITILILDVPTSSSFPGTRDIYQFILLFYSASPGKSRDSSLFLPHRFQFFIYYHPTIWRYITCAADTSFNKTLWINSYIEKQLQVCAS